MALTYPSITRHIWQSDIVQQIGLYEYTGVVPLRPLIRGYLKELSENDYYSPKREFTCEAELILQRNRYNELVLMIRKAELG